MLASANLTLKNRARITIALHRNQYVFEDINIADLVIQIIECIAFINAVFNQNRRVFADGSAFIDKHQRLIVEQVFVDKFLYSLVVYFGWNTTNASAVAFFYCVLKTVRFCVVNAIEFLTQMVR